MKPFFDALRQPEYGASAMAVLGIGVWIAYAGGKVRHREFRNEPPPTLTTTDNAVACRWACRACPSNGAG